jgi:hypothetical protein
MTIRVRRIMGGKRADGKAADKRDRTRRDRGV